MTGETFSIHTLIDGAVGSPFAKLRTLLSDVPPGITPAIDLSLGEPREQMPDFVAQALQDATSSLAKYPMIQGSATLREAIASWVKRRYGDNVALDPEREILPCNGSREGLFYACFAAVARREMQARPAVLMCNPFYQVYLGAALAAGAEPIFLNATEASGHLPDLDELEANPDLLKRTVAFYLCSPANPQGAIASADYLKRATALARRHNFMLFVDECYAEIYGDQPPPGVLQVAQQTGGGFGHVVAFHSLSKRSNLPGLRSGFSAGDPVFHEQLFRLRNLAGPQMPGPIQRASAMVWDDDAHVAANRLAYQQKFDLCDSVLGEKFGYQRPQGGFFLWLDMRQIGSSSEATVTIWKRFGVKVVPGADLAQNGLDGRNLGDGFVRVALVQDRATLKEALERIVSVAA